MFATIATSIGTNIVNDKLKFRVTFLYVVFTPPVIPDKVYHIKDTALTFSMPKFAMTATPAAALPAGITWTYTLFYTDQVTAAPAFIGRTTITTATGPTPVVNFSIYSLTNADYNSGVTGLHSLTMVATNSLGLTSTTSFDV